MPRGSKLFLCSLFKPDTTTNPDQHLYLDCQVVRVQAINFAHAEQKAREWQNKHKGYQLLKIENEVMYAQR